MNGKILVIFAALGWSALGTMILLLPEAFSPQAVSAVRGLWIAGFFLTASFMRKNLPRVNLPVVIAGIAYALSAFTYIASLLLVPVAMAAPLHYTSPVFLVLGLAFVRKKFPGAVELCGVLLGLSGSLILISSGDASSLLGIAHALVSAILWAVYLVVQKLLSVDERNHAAFYGGMFMALGGLAWVPTTGWSSGSVASLIVIGVFCSVLPLYLLARGSASVSSTSASLILLLEPAFAAALALIVHGQMPSPNELTGLVLIVLGAGCGSAVSATGPLRGIFKLPMGIRLQKLI